MYTLVSWAKEHFESYVESHSVVIEGYHVDNGQFANYLFCEAAQQSGQSITFCGVGAHHQNGIIERPI